MFKHGAAGKGEMSYSVRVAVQHSKILYVAYYRRRLRKKLARFTFGTKYGANIFLTFF